MSHGYTVWASVAPAGEDSDRVTIVNHSLWHPIPSEMVGKPLQEDPFPSALLGQPSIETCMERKLGSALFLSVLAMDSTKTAHSHLLRLLEA